MTSPAKVAVMVFPGTNSEEETARICRDVGLHADIIHWSQADRMPKHDAYILPGGFAYEDRIRAGAIAAHDRLMDRIIEEAQQGTPVLGLCNGAQILLEAGLVPGTGPVRRPTAAFTKNRPAHFICKHVYVKLTIDPARSVFTQGLQDGALIPTWAAHGEGRLAATDERLQEILEGGHLAFTYAHADGTTDEAAVPNGSALGCAGLINKRGNVLAIMPHPERDAWNFNHPDRREGDDIMRPSGGAVFFESLAKGLDK